MKKVLLVTGVALLALASVSSAATLTKVNLTVGSTGDAVSALQSTLISMGYSIPAITAGTAPGYFGSQTKAALIAYQTKVGLPAQGFYGPLTYASMTSGSTGTSMASNCLAGWTAISYNGTSACLPPGYAAPAGSTVTPPPAGSPATGLTAGVDGSVSVSDSSFVSSGQTVKKGETKNVVAVKLQATAGAVEISRLDVHFSVRPWLFFNQVTLTDSSGKVIATKPIMSAADATEITVGSDYLVRFEGLNYIVAPGTNPDLAVGVSVLSATDKITNGMVVYAGIPLSAIRTMNGIGISDSVGGIAFGNNTSGVGARSFTLSSTGSVADLSTKISSVAPATQTSQTVSKTVSTQSIPLGIFSVQSQNNSATLQSVNFQINTNPNFAKTGLFSNIRIMIGSQTYGALSFNDAGLATFTNLSIALPQDQWVDLKLVADVAATSTDVLASSTLVADSLNAIDSTYTQATVGGLTYTNATNDQTSANTLLTVNSVALTSASAAAGTAVTTGTSNAPVRYPVTYTFTLANNSNNSMYVSSDVSLLLGTSTSPTNASSTITAFFPLPSAVAGDSAGVYIIPNGSSRTFSVTGTIQKSSNSSTAESLSVSGINYSSTQTYAKTGTISTGLEKLSVLVAF